MGMSDGAKVYLAGPEVFLPDAAEIGRQKLALCAKYGFQGLYPADNDVSTGAGRSDVLIYRKNVAMMRDAQMAIFNLTPFRGPSADVGTVFEVGLLVGLNKPIFGYTNVADDLLTRVTQYFRQIGKKLAAPSNPARDPEGMTIEAFGNADNLMIDVAFLEQGHPIVRHAAKAADRYRDLTGFEECLRRAAQELAVTPSAV
jgi:nucleoside 2-deoxyribosyltransferase